jgi:hypothetical protein
MPSARSPWLLHGSSTHSHTSPSFQIPSLSAAEAFKAKLAYIANVFSKAKW